MSGETPTQTIKAAFAERVSHPVFGLLVLAWLICNWQAVFVLVVDADPAEPRITRALGHSSFLTLTVLPVLLTVAYILISPLLRNLAFAYDRYVNEKNSIAAYEAELKIFSRKAEIAHRQIEDLNRQIAEKIDARIRAENELKARSDDRNRMHQAIGELAEMSGPEWSSFFGNNQVEDLMSHVKEKRLHAFREKWERAVLLRDAVLKAADSKDSPLTTAPSIQEKLPILPGQHS